MKVLLADNNLSVLSALPFWLETLDTVTTVSAVTDADLLLEAVAATPPDVVLLDWGLTGLPTHDARRQFMQTVRIVLPYVRIFVLSSRPDLKWPALVAGADAFVSKAEPPDALRNLLTNWPNS